jgi:hypothetical protein
MKIPNFCTYREFKYPAKSGRVLSVRVYRNSIIMAINPKGKWEEITREDYPYLYPAILKYAKKLRKKLPIIKI